VISPPSARVIYRKLEGIQISRRSAETQFDSVLDPDAPKKNA
jgi:hypothetical protein